jgi:GT2 family glycosyltransferase
MSVTVGIVTWNSAHVIEACVASVRAQTYRPLTLRILDNASADDTRERLKSITAPDERLGADRNLGFSAAHNRLIAGSSTEFYLCLNPDVILTPGFVDRIVAAMRRDPRAGSATGKLLRMREDGAGDTPHPSPLPASGAREPHSLAPEGGEGRVRGLADVIDSTGIVMVPSQRHLDRGADRVDDGRYAREELVFGASGAAAMYRRAMLDDARTPGGSVMRGGNVTPGGNAALNVDAGSEYFDEDFFAYREDADLAWRAQLLGWNCVYVPDAVARHGRRVTPERRSALPAAINYYSVRNRFLLRMKNQTAGHALRFLLPTLARDLQVIGYVLLKERSSIGALGDVCRLWRTTMLKRRAIMSRRRRPTSEMIAWFTRTDA